MISVAIDGPSGAGKSSLAKRLAADMGFTYVDTGAMYRSIGLYAVRQGKDPHDAAAVEALLPQIHLDTKLEEGTQHFYLNGEDVSSAIRAEEIGMAASAVAACLALLVGVCLAMPGIAASIQTGNYSGFETAASIFHGGAALGYIVIGLLAFLLGVCVTVLCFRLRQMDREDDQNKESEGIHGAD